MADYIRFDGEGIITKKYQSVDGADIKDQSDILKVDRTTLLSITKYHKVDSGTVVEMSQPEKDALDQAEADAQAQALLDRIEKYEVSNLDLLTALVKRINVRIPSNPITKAELIAELKTMLGL